MVMDADTFESFCAALWSKSYSYVYRTRKSGPGDGGIDIVAIRDNEGALLQCKTSSISGAKLNWDAVKEVVGGEAAYRIKHPGVQFQKYAVTNQYFNDNTRAQAELNDVRLINQQELTELLKINFITRFEMERYLIPEWETSNHSQ